MENIDKTTKSQKDLTLDLVKWWMEAFSKDEREYMVSQYLPIGRDTRERFLKNLAENSNPNAYRFLGGLATWFRDKEHATIKDRIYKKIVEISKEYPLCGPGFFGGRHYTTYVTDIEILKKQDRAEELERLLLNLIDAIEQESRNTGLGVAPGYYQELAILYRKGKDFKKEVEILERFARQQHAPGVLPPRLLDRLEKAKDLKAKSDAKYG